MSSFLTVEQVLDKMKTSYCVDSIEALEAKISSNTDQASSNSETFLQELITLRIEYNEALARRDGRSDDSGGRSSPRAAAASATASFAAPEDEKQGSGVGGIEGNIVGTKEGGGSLSNNQGAAAAIPSASGGGASGGGHGSDGLAIDNEDVVRGDATCIYVGNLAEDCTKEILKTVFFNKPKIGNVVKVDICKDKFSNKSLGFGFITYKTHAEAERALSELNSSVITTPSGSRPCCIMWAKGVQVFQKWEEMNLKPNLLRGLYAMNFENPTPIQGKALIPIVFGRDVLAQAQSGTGKTGAFCSAALQLIDDQKLACQCIVLSPVHELADQSNQVMQDMGAFMGKDGKGIQTRCFLGGKQNPTASANIQEIQQGIHVAVGTPGRMFDLIERGSKDPSKGLSVKDVKLLIIDEADEIFSNFSKDLKRIMQLLPPTQSCKVALFSATIPEELRNALNDRGFLQYPIEILVNEKDLALKGLSHYEVVIDMKEREKGKNGNLLYTDTYESIMDVKYATLTDLLGKVPHDQCIVFANDNRDVTWISNQLKRDKFSVECFHSEVADRKQACDNFKSKRAKVLISSDALSRGYDVVGVDLVINFDVSLATKLKGEDSKVSEGHEVYVHRVGRAARYGRKGKAITFVVANSKCEDRSRGGKPTGRLHFEDVRNLEVIMKHYDYKINQLLEHAASKI